MNRQLNSRHQTLAVALGSTLVAASLWLPQNALGADKIIDRFDGQTVGDFPAGWVNDGTASFITISTNHAVSLPNSMHLLDTSTTLRALVTQDIDKRNDTIFLSFDLRNDSNGQYIISLLGDKSSGGIGFGPRLTFFANGTRAVNDGGPNVFIANYPLNTFQHYDFVIDIPNQSYSLAINGASVGGPFAFEDAGLTNLFHLRIGDTAPSSTMNTYIDNVVLVPEPGAMVVIGGTGLGLLLLRRRQQPTAGE